MKHCTYCGAELAEEAICCAVCGQPTQQAPVEAEPLAAQTEAAPYASEVPTEDAPFVCEMPCAPKKKKRWPWFVAGIALLLAAVAALYFFVLRKPEPTPPTPQESLTAAMEATVSDFKDIFAKTETLVERVKSLESLRQESAHIAVDALIDGPEDDSDLNSIGMKVEGNFDTNGDVYAEGDIELNIDMYENELPLSLHFSVDREELQLSLPKYLDDVYSLPFEDLMEQLDIDEEDLAPLLEAFEPQESTLDTEELKTQLRELWATAEFTDITDTVTEIPVEGEAKLYECYQVVFDKELLAQPFELLTEAMQKNDPGFELEYPEIESLVFHVYNDKVVGMEVLHTYEGESNRDGLWLKGENNPWERIEATEDGETQDGVILIEATEQGFTLTFESEDSRVVLDYNDTDCSLVIRRTDDGYQDQEIKLSLREWEGGLELALDMQMDDMSVALSMGIAPMKTAPERLSEEAENLLTMSQKELEELLMKILMELATDPETSWILDAMQGVAA